MPETARMAALDRDEGRGQKKIPRKKLFASTKCHVLSLTSCRKPVEASVWMYMYLLVISMSLCGVKHNDEQRQERKDFMSADGVQC